MVDIVARFSPSLTMLAIIVGCLLVPSVDRWRARWRRRRELRCWAADVRRADLRRMMMRSYVVERDT